MDEAVSEMELRVAALEMLVMELMAQLPTDARRKLGHASPQDGAFDSDTALVRNRILAIRSQILANAVTTEASLEGLVMPLRLRSDND